MPDATESKVTVDGVEPSILVRLLDTKDNPERVKLATDDDGGERFLVKSDWEMTRVTPADLANLGVVEIEVIGNQPEETVVVAPSAPSTAPSAPAQNAPSVVAIPDNKPPGQGQ